MARRNIVQEYFSERVVYGGLAATRGEVYDDVMKSALSRGASDSEARRVADYSASKVIPCCEELWELLVGKGMTLRNVLEREK